MRRLLLLLLVLLLPALPAHAQSEPDTQIGYVDTTNYPEITVYVRVNGTDGQPVAGLTAGDFKLTEDGQPVTISGFKGGGAGAISTVLVIDRSGSMSEEDKLEGAKAAARAFIDQMRQGDQTAVIAFSDRPELEQPFTGDLSRLERSIRSLRADGSTALYDSLISGVETLKGAKGRLALLLLTDGRDCWQMPCDQQASRASLDEAIAAASQAGIAVQVIGLGDRDTDDASSGIDEGVLKQIADATGGAYFYAPDGDELARLYRQLSADMQQEYALTYHSPRPFYDGTRRDIEVSVGGAAPVASGYVERHLINVHSDPGVGLLLLVPLLALLLVPALRRRLPPLDQALPTTDHRPPTTDHRLPTADQSVPASQNATPTEGSTGQQPSGVMVVSSDVPRCQSCDAALLRLGARFCNVCGAPQEAVTAQRIFCDQCGRPMRTGAHFCSTCGTSAPFPTGAQS
jgi:Ca-activated chloride channel family protein